MDMSEFDLKDKEEDDYNLFDFFIMKPDIERVQNVQRIQKLCLQSI